MLALLGWKLEPLDFLSSSLSQLFELPRWDLDAAKEIFQDDALIVAAFVVSTVSMILLGFFLRQFVAVRTLLEASSSFI